MPAPKATGPNIHGALSLGIALEQSQALANLMQRLQQSRERFAAIRNELPEALRDQVRPGPLDDAGWTLLVPGGAAASKLRQILPALDESLLRQGWQRTSIRVKIQ